MNTKLQTIQRIALFMIWLVILTPIYSANALEINFSPDSGVEVTDISARIRWSTDENSSGRVKYNVEGGPVETAVSERAGTEHDVEITGIASETEFMFYIEARNETHTVRDPVDGGDFHRFTTQALRDRTPPRPLASLAAPSMTNNSITLEWEKNAGDSDVDHYVIYRAGGAGNGTGDELLADDIIRKSYTVTGLIPSTEYIFKAAAVDTSSNEGEKKSVRATTRGSDFQSVIISAFSAEAIGTSVYLSWTTNILSHSRAKYSQNPLVLDQKKEDPSMVFSHNITLTELPPNSAITLMAESCDTNGSCGSSEALTVNTTEHIDLTLRVDGMDCDPSTMAFANTNRLTVQGTASLGSDVSVFVNGVKQRFKRITSTGQFSFAGLDLSPSLQQNSIRVTANNGVSPVIECSENVILDYYAPEVNFRNETEITRVSTSGTVQLRGNVTDDNKVTLYVYLQSVDDTTPPLTPTILDDYTAAPNSISFNWVSGSVPASDSAASESEEELSSESSSEESSEELSEAEEAYASYYGEGGSGEGESGSAGAEGSASGVTSSRRGISAVDEAVYLYLIYRSDVADGPITAVEPTQTSFTDVNVSTATTYTYQVSAIDRAGNDGGKSSPVSITTQANGTANVPLISKIIPPNPSLVLTKEFTTSNTTIEFTETISGLFQGRTSVRVQFVDLAGNMFEQNFEVPYDSAPPEIITPTSEELQRLYSPTYMSELLIRGQINKQVGQVWVWIDPSASLRINTGSISGSFQSDFGIEPSTKVTVGENGTFEAEVSLTSSLTSSVAGAFTGSSSENGTSGSVAISSGSGESHRLVMVAFDSYGRASAPVEAELEYTPCGSSYYWSIELSEGGNVINTRELIEGVATYGFGYELEWVGGGDARRAVAQNVRVVRATVGEEERKKYDFDWLAGEPQILSRSYNQSKGFVLINFAPQSPEGATYLEKEKNLSKHRKGECGPIGGCIKLLLEMQIDSDSGPLMPGQYIPPGAEGTPYDPRYSGSQYDPRYSDQSGSNYAYETGYGQTTEPIQTQKQCIQINIMLDERIDFASSDFVKSLLRGSIDLINSTLDFINMVEEPIRYTTQVVLGICLVSYVAKFLVDALESYYCRWKSSLSRLASADVEGVVGAITEIRQGSIERIASMHNDEQSGGGACDLEFPEGGEDANEQANQACKDCASWKSKKRWMTNKFHLFCDRVMCPSVPSLQQYILENYDRGRRRLWTPPAGTADSDAATSNPTETPVATPAPEPEAAAPTPAGALILDITGNVARESITPSGVSGSCPRIAGVTGNRIEPAPQAAIYLYDCPTGAGNRWADENSALVVSGIIERTDAGHHSFWRTNDRGSAVEPGYLSLEDLRAGRAASATPSTLTLSPEAEAGSAQSEESPEVGGSERNKADSRSGRTSSLSGGSQSPVYSKVYDYKSEDYKRTDLRNIKSDCSFANQGANSIKAMMDFYEANKDTPDGKACKTGHVPQPACCPFEYMNEWGWGMMFSNELKLSYCFAEPNGEGCGTGESIQRGVTGICNPRSEAPRGEIVILNDLKWRNNYPDDNRNRVNNDVVFMVNLDEKGSGDSIRLGYFSKSEVTSIGTEVAEDGSVDISVGNRFVPENSQEDWEELFPTRNSADLTQDEDNKEYKRHVREFTTKLREKITGDDPVIVSRRSSARFTETDYERWYRQIYDILGEPGVQYLAQPAGSFIQSVLTLCLSGILSWLVQFKNMLMMLQQCFQTILITGDGSSGQCQAIISQYICDIIQEAISCLTTRLGGGSSSSSSRVGIGGISGLFSAISDTSRSMTEEVQSRYGDRNLFSTTFSAENVLHDACIFMFTGEWPTDWSQIFEASSYLPINSSGLVFPVTRRWQAYDPNTGYSRYVYRVAYSIFAGSDIHFDVELQCSGPNVMCETPDGGMEPCDCSYEPSLDRYYQMGRQPFLRIQRHQSGNCPETGDLRQGQSCTDEIMFVTDQPLPLRFDKAVVKYMPLQTTGSPGYGGASFGTTGGTGGTGFGGNMADVRALTGQIEGRVREIGAPVPDLNCHFDVGLLAYRCGVEVPSGGYARIVSAEPVSMNPFGVGDSELVRVRIQQELPEDTHSCSGECETTKYFLVREIRNHRGARVYPPETAAGSRTSEFESPPAERLNEGGIYDWIIFDPSTFIVHPPFRISQESFSGRASRPRTSPSGMRFMVSSSIDASRLEPSTAIRVFFDGDSLTYQEGTMEGRSSTSFSSTGEVRECESYSLDAVSETNNPEATCGSVCFRLDGHAVARRTASKSAIPDETHTTIYYNEALSTTSMSEEECLRPMHWSMLLELRDAIQVGGAGYRMAPYPSRDFETGREQVKRVDFYVSCGEGAGSGISDGSIAELRERSTIVRAENNALNPTFGLWVDENTLGPTERITVGDFDWINDENHGEGFRLNIDSGAEWGILNIDVDRIDLVPTSELQIEKEGSERTRTLEQCGDSPCIESRGGEESQVIRLRLGVGDPTFTFRGFVSGGAESRIVLNYLEPTYLINGQPALRLHSPISEYFDRMILNRGAAESNSLSYNYQIISDAPEEPVTLGLALSQLGYTVEDHPTVSVGGTSLPACEGYEIPTAESSEAGGSVVNEPVGKSPRSSRGLDQPCGDVSGYRCRPESELGRDSCSWEPTGGVECGSDLVCCAPE